MARSRCTRLFPGRRRVMAGNYCGRWLKGIYLRDGNKWSQIEGKGWCEDCQAIDSPRVDLQELAGKSRARRIQAWDRGTSPAVPRKEP